MTALPVTISIPADPANISMLRASVATIASRSNFTLEEIEDLRIAVSEAATLLLPRAETITCSLAWDGESVTVTCACDGSNPLDRNLDELPWVLLEALVDEASATTDGQRIEIRLFKKSHLQQ